MNKRLPPQAIEAEENILGTMMLGAQEEILQAISSLVVDDFYKPAHAEIFSAMCALFAAGESIDLVTVVNAVRAAGKIEMVGGVSYLSGLTETIPFPGLVNRYAPIIKEKATARKIISLSEKMMHRCYRDERVKDVTEDFGKDFFNIITDRTKGARHISAVVKDVKKEINDTHENGIQVGIPTGFIDLDNRWNGMQRGEMILMAGRPSMGKTALAMNIASNVAFSGYKVLVFSLEMKDKGLVQRMMSTLSAISSDGIRKGNLPDEHLARVMRAGDMAADLGMWIDETAGLSLSDLSARAKMQALKNGVDLIVVDYLQLMKAPGENRTQEVSTISQGLKNLAKDLDVPVLALSQLNRGLANRTDKRPVLTDLRESGSLEQDADVIAMIHRDDYYNRDNDNPNRGIAEVITAKHRNGPTGTDNMLFQGEFSKFLTMEQIRR